MKIHTEYCESVEKEAVQFYLVTWKYGKEINRVMRVIKKDYRGTRL